MREEKYIGRIIFVLVSFVIVGSLLGAGYFLQKEKEIANEGVYVHCPADKSLPCTATFSDGEVVVLEEEKLSDGRTFVPVFQAEISNPFYIPQED